MNDHYFSINQNFSNIHVNIALIDQELIHRPEYQVHHQPISDHHPGEPGARPYTAGPSSPQPPADQRLDPVPYAQIRKKERTSVYV